MKKIILLLTVLAVFTFSGCSMLKKTNTPNADRKSDNAVPKESNNDVIIEMEDE